MSSQLTMGPAVEQPDRRHARAQRARRWARAPRASSLRRRAFLVAAVALAVAGAAARAFDLLLAACARRSPTRCVARGGVPAGAGIVVPTQLVFVPMLLLLPTPLVPLLVAAALRALRPTAAAMRGGRARRADLARAGGRLVRGRPGARARARRRADARAGTDAPWYAARARRRSWRGDARGRPSLRARLALGARAARDARSSCARLPRRRCCSRPVGLLAAFGAAGAPYAVLLVLPLVALFALVRARAGGADRRRARALPGLPRHRAPARRRDRGRRPVHRRPHQGRRRAHAAGRRPRSASTTRPAAAPSSARCCTTSARSTSRTRSSTSRGRSTTTSG